MTQAMIDARTPDAKRQLVPICAPTPWQAVGARERAVDQLAGGAEMQLGLARLGDPRAWPLHFTGRLSDVVADARQAPSMRRYGWSMHAGAAYAVLVHGQIERGDLRVQPGQTSTLAAYMCVEPGASPADVSSDRGRARAPCAVPRTPARGLARGES